MYEAIFPFSLTCHRNSEEALKRKVEMYDFVTAMCSREVFTLYSRHRHKKLLRLDHVHVGPG
jgi:hypothetical protein